MFFEDIETWDKEAYLKVLDEGLDRIKVPGWKHDLLQPPTVAVFSAEKGLGRQVGCDDEFGWKSVCIQAWKVRGPCFP